VSAIACAQPGAGAASAGRRVRDLASDERCRRPASLRTRPLVRSRYNRFFGALHELPPAELWRVTHLDRKYDLALVAETHVGEESIVIAEARHALSLDRLECEFAPSVADEWRAAQRNARAVRGVDGNLSMNAARHADQYQSIDDTIVQ
jgi:hypothetical protein